MPSHLSKHLQETGETADSIVLPTGSRQELQFEVARLKRIISAQQQWCNSLAEHYTSVHENLMIISKSVLTVKEENAEFLKNITEIHGSKRDD